MLTACALGARASVVVATLSGCSTYYVRYVNNAIPAPSQQQWVQDRYACFQQAQQGPAQVDGGAGSSLVAPSCGAFNACLAARGYYRTDTTNAADLDLPGSYGVPQSPNIRC